MMTMTDEKMFIPVSSGTLRFCDLIPRFFEALETYFLTNKVVDVFKVHTNGFAPPEEAYADEQHSYWESDDAAWYLEELIMFLNEFCLDGYYFGTHPGDGAEFGFIPMEWNDES